MAEKSMFWSTGSTGDGLNPYTQTEWFELWRRTLSTDNHATESVVGGDRNELAVTSGTDSVNVNTGSAFVAGIPYTNSASVSLAITRPVVNTTGVNVVLRASWSAQTVRLVAIRNTDGVATIPAVTQSDGVTWEVSLATATITTLGAVTVTDNRAFLMGRGSLQYRQGGSATRWDTAGTTQYIVPSFRQECGVVNWSGGAATSGQVLITHSTFSYRPVYICTAIEGSTAIINCTMRTNISAATAAINWCAVDGVTTFTSIDIQWVAMGPA